MSTKGEFVEILEFTHFARVFKFSGQENFGRKKEISNEIKVSVVMEQEKMLWVMLLIQQEKQEQVKVF